MAFVGSFDFVVGVECPRVGWGQNWRIGDVNHFKFFMSS